MGIAAGVTGVCLVAIAVGFAFGVAFGLQHAMPRYHGPQLHEGRWQYLGLVGTVVMWERKEVRRKNCHDQHRAYVCTILSSTAHVDACDCGRTRQGVYGQWQ